MPVSVQGLTLWWKGSSAEAGYASALQYYEGRREQLCLHGRHLHGQLYPCQCPLEGIRSW